ncbi:MAG: response regulator [Burkholderiaceae bacterium]|nr:MAG: response regulator [Burkholderiaceae bacterium]
MVRPAPAQHHRGAAREAMFNTVYVLERDPAECRWIESALAGQVRKLIFLEDGATLLDWLATQGGDCLLCGAEPDASVALELVRRLRRHGQALPVVVIGPHSAFRTAVDVARLNGTDFLERPVSAQRLRAALRKVTAVTEEGAKR